MTEDKAAGPLASTRVSQPGPPLIGTKPRFIFVHIPKAAGTSVRDAFKPYVRRPNPVSRWMARKFPKPLVQGDLHAHSSALAYRNTLGPAFDDHFVFTFVRNPFSWLVSFRSYVLDRPNHPQHELVNSMSFDAWIAHRHEEAREGKGMTQSKFILDENGESLVDFIGRVETISEDIAALNARLGTKAEVRHLNRSSHQPVAAHFTPETAEMVVDAFRGDFDYFGYDTVPPET